MTGIIEHPTLSGYGSDEEGGVWSRRRTKEWRRLAPFRHHSGYLHFNPHGRSYKVHRFVLECFAGPCPEGMQCRHLDGDKTNNRPSNLAWGSSAENKADQIAHGTIADFRGERHPQAKLTEADVRAIRADSRRQTDIAHDYGIDRSMVSQIKLGKCWGHVPLPLPGEAQ